MTNERPETKREKFERLRDSRLPKITHAIDILGNLGGSGYESTEAERRAVVETLQAHVDAVAISFNVHLQSPQPQLVAKSESQPELVASRTVSGEDANPTDPAEGGALAKHEISWAYDAVMRKDWKLAANRLKRVIDMWRDPS